MQGARGDDLGALQDAGASCLCKELVPLGSAYASVVKASLDPQRYVDARTPRSRREARTVSGIWLMAVMWKVMRIIWVSNDLVGHDVGLAQARRNVK